jgi:hypothetical protein
MKQTPPELHHDFPSCTFIDVEEQEKHKFMIKKIDHPLVQMSTPLSIRQASDGPEGGPIEAPFVGGIEQEKLSGDYGEWVTKIYVENCVRIFALLDRCKREGEDVPEEQLERLSKYFEMKE